MKFRHAIFIATIAFVAGCSNQLNPEAHVAVSDFRNQLSEYVDLLKTSRNPRVMIDDFSPLLVCWEKITTEQKIPRSQQNQIDSSLNLYHYYLVCFDNFLDMDPDIDRPPLEEKERTLYWQNKSTEVYNTIDDRYWSILKLRLKEQNCSAESLALLEELQNNPVQLIYKNSKVSMEILRENFNGTFKILASLLDK